MQLWLQPGTPSHQTGLLGRTCGHGYCGAFSCLSLDGWFCFAFLDQFRHFVSARKFYLCHESFVADKTYEYSKSVVREQDDCTEMLTCEIRNGVIVLINESKRQPIDVGANETLHADTGRVGQLEGQHVAGT